MITLNWTHILDKKTYRVRFSSDIKLKQLCNQYYEAKSEDSVNFHDYGRITLKHNIYRVGTHVALQSITVANDYGRNNIKTSHISGRNAFRLAINPRCRVHA